MEQYSPKDTISHQTACTLFLPMWYIGFDAENRLVESVNVLCDVICDIADKVFKGQKLIAYR